MTVTRIVPADVLTPIGAYAALAQPQASCLLESVESGGRISRYSFIGLDYRAVSEFDSGSDLYDRVRAFISANRNEGEEGERLGGALLAFAYDAARSDARLAPRPPSVPAMPAAYVAIPATWLICTPTVELPVNEIFRTRLSAQSGGPIRLPSPVMH